MSARAPTSEIRSRRAEARDVRAITAIYNQGIAERIATFETQPRAESDVMAWLESRFPVVVVENAEGVVAFASTSLYRSRACYLGIAEFSVYVERAHRRLGIGRVALETLLEAAEADRFWKLISRIFVENTASRELCRALGFREVGTYRRHAKLDGAWRDVVIVERLLGQAAENL
jgi:phosphinothricin acetyltransferase